VGGRGVLCRHALVLVRRMYAATPVPVYGSAAQRASMTSVAVSPRVGAGPALARPGSVSGG